MPAAIAEGSIRPVEDVEEDEFELSPPVDSSLSSSFMPKSSSRQSSREIELLTSLLLMVLLTVPVEAVDADPPSTLRTFIRGTLLSVLLVLAAMDFSDDSDKRVVLVVEAELPGSVELLLLDATGVAIVVVAIVVGDDPVVL